MRHLERENENLEGTKRRNTCTKLVAMVEVETHPRRRGSNQLGGTKTDIDAEGMRRKRGDLCCHRIGQVYRLIDPRYRPHGLIAGDLTRARRTAENWLGKDDHQMMIVSGFGGRQLRSPFDFLTTTVIRPESGLDADSVPASHMATAMIPADSGHISPTCPEGRLRTTPPC